MKASYFYRWNLMYSLRPKYGVVNNNIFPNVGTIRRTVNDVVNKY